MQKKSKPQTIATFCLVASALVVALPALATETENTQLPWYSTSSVSQPLFVAERKRSFSNRQRSSSSSSYKIKQDDLDEEEVVRSVISLMVDDIELDDDVDDVLDKLEDASEGQQAIFCLVMLQDKVNNGGFDLYLNSDAANLIKEVRDGLLLLDAQRYLKILDKVLALFVNHQDSISDRETRQFVLKQIPQARRESVLDRLDEEFFALELEGLLNTHMEYYIRKNPKQFFKN